MPFASPIDKDVLEMLAELQAPGEPDLVSELVELFLRDTPDRLRVLETRPLAVADVTRAAHSVKGSAGNIGAVALQAQAAALEEAGHQRASVETLEALADAVIEEYARAAVCLREMLTERA